MLKPKDLVNIECHYSIGSFCCNTGNLLLLYFASCLLVNTI